MGSKEDDLEDAIAAYKAGFARAGGLARAKKLSPEQRQAIATKASKAAAKVRSAKARALRAKKKAKKKH